jgi:VIT1/CCC1 family predicted Fe2+/Mn2+ transporter
MIFPRVKKVGKDNQWKRTSSTVFGEYKGYWFNIGDGLGFKYINASLDILEDATKTQLHTLLEHNKKRIGYHQYEVLSGAVHIKFNENLTSTSREKLDNGLDFLVTTFEQLGLPKMNACHSCRENSNLRHYEVSGEGKLLCNTCANTIEGQMHDSMRKDSLEEKNYLSGFIGAFLFSFAGVAAWVILQQLGYLSSALALVIAFLALRGYTYFKGKIGAFTPLIIIATGMLAVVAANYISYLVSFLLEGLSLNDFLFYYRTNEQISGELHKNLGLSFILSAFVWIWLFFTIRQVQPSLKPAREIA